MEQTKPAPDVRPGQVWADNDWRMVGRTLRVDEVRHSPRLSKPAALCTVLTNTDDIQQRLDAGSLTVQDRRGAQTEIAINRFRPTSTGYRLVED